MILFLAVALSVYGLVNFYVARRGFQALAAAPPARTVFLVLFAVLALAFPVGRILLGGARGWFATALAEAGMFHMAVMLYALMAVAAWRVWRHGGWARQKAALSLFIAQWALNTLWTPLFFGLHRPGWALAEILILLIAILATIRAFWRADQPAGLLLIPYAAWVAFATVLNWTIWRLN